MEITQPESNRFLKCLIFAPSGQGKTRFIATANDDERTAPMLLLDYEGGTQSLVGRKIDIVRITSWDDYNQVYAMLSGTEHQFKSVGLDSISETHLFALLSLLTQGDKTRKIPDLLEQGDYGIALVQMRRFLRTFRDLPMHLFATAMSKSDIDPREGTVIKPALVGALADEVPGIFDLVSYLATTSILNPETQEDEIHRVMVLQNYPKFRTKARIPEGLDAEVPDEIVDPTVTSLMDVLHFPKATGKTSKKEGSK